jgi:Tol biopolymer transport system component
VAFASWSRRLVARDTNGQMDVFVRDTRTGTTKRVSLTSRGRQANGRSEFASISGDGRFVAFESRASNLASGDHDSDWDVFLRDLKRNTTKLVSIRPGDNHRGAAPSISADGSSVAFQGLNGYIYVRNLRTRKTEQVPTPTIGDRALGSGTPSLSGDGGLVAFTTYEEFSTPIPRSGTDVFVRDLKTGTTEKVSVSPHPEETDGFSDSPRISANGRFVAFASAADPITGVVSDGGEYRRDLEKHTTERISVSSSGEIGNNFARATAISANGRFVAFSSYATNLVPGDTNDAPDVFLRDVATSTTSRVSVSDSGEQGTFAGGAPYEAASGDPALSGDARFVGFQSHASNLVEGDTNNVIDIFVRGPLQR